MASCAQQEALVGLPRAQRALLAANTWHAGYLLAFYRFLVVKRPHITPPPSAKILGLPDSHMTARLSSEVGVAESGVAESGGRDANGAAEAQDCHVKPTMPAPSTTRRVANFELPVGAKLVNLCDKQIGPAAAILLAGVVKGSAVLTTLE